MKEKNRIVTLKLENNTYIHDQAGIISQTYEFFHKFFKSNHHKSIKVIIPKGRIGLNDAEKEDLGRMPTENEIKNAVFSFHPFKAPGPDGLHPFFYYKYWDILSQSVYDFCFRVLKE